MSQAVMCWVITKGSRSSAGSNAAALGWARIGMLHSGAVGPHRAKRPDPTQQVPTVSSSHAG